MVSCTPPTHAKPIPSTQTIYTPIHTPPTHIPLALNTSKNPICMKKFQDSLNDAVATLLWPSVGGEAQHLEKVRIWSPPGLPNV